MVVVVVALVSRLLLTVTVDKSIKSRSDVDD